MSGVALVVDPRLGRRFAAAAATEGRTVVGAFRTADQFLRAVAPADVLLVLVSAQRTRLTAELLARCDERGVRLVAVAATEAERRHAASLGVYEVVGADAGWAEVERAASTGVPLALRDGRGPAAGTDAAEPGRAGRVIVVWGPAGAPGRTTVAITLAALFAQRGRRVVLVDADTYGGAIAPALRLDDEAPGFAAACRLAGAGALTSAELDRLAVTHPGAGRPFRVLTGLMRPTRWPELASARVRQVLAACAAETDEVVVDVGFNLETDEEIASDVVAPRRNAATHAALRAADRVVAVAGADPVGLSRFLAVHPELAEATEAPVTVVANRVRASAAGPAARMQVAHLLARFGGVEDPVLVPDDPRAVDLALREGACVGAVAPRSPMWAVLRRLVETRLDVPAEVRR